MGAHLLRAHVEVKEEVLGLSLHGVGDRVFLSFLCWASWHQLLGIFLSLPPSSPSWCPGIADLYTTASSLSVGYRDLNSGRQACMTSHLLTEQASQPQCLPFKDNYKEAVKAQVEAAHD